MREFLSNLEEELNKKKFYKDEIIEVVSYYEEIISDRVDNGEVLEEVLKSYDIKKISNFAFPEAIKRRRPKNSKEVGKNIGLLILFLFSMPLLIPLGIVYFSFLIVIVALIISVIAVVISGAAGFIGLIINLIITKAVLSNALVVVGAYILVILLATVLLYYIIKGLYALLKGSVVLVAKLIPGGKKYE